MASSMEVVGAPSRSAESDATGAPSRSEHLDPMVAASRSEDLDPTLLKWLWQEGENSKSRVRTVRMSFDAIDTDGNGSLSFAELKSSESIRTALSEAEIEQLIRKFDDNQDGEIQFDEFQRMWQEAMAAKSDGTEDEKPAAAPVFIIRDRLKLRCAVSMQSKITGDIEAGKKVHVLEWSSDGQRARIALTSEPEVPLGWASVFAKDGFENILPATHEGSMTASTHAQTPAAKGRRRQRRATITETLLGMARSSSKPAVEASPAEMTEAEKHAAWLGAVRRCVLLDHLPPAELSFISQARREISTVEGETLYAQGDPIHAGLLYIVASGVYRVTIETAKLGAAEARTVTRRTRDYGPQENFGACEMLCNDTSGRRTCTVVVHKAGLLWGIPRRLIDLKLRVPPPPIIPDLVPFCRQV